MAGAIAGTALVNYASNISKKLSTVTLTVNNLCNLQCPHCYLQYDGGETKYISSSILEHLYNAEFKHLVIVGKEPFVNTKTVLLLDEIVKTVKEQNRTIGVISNGLGLDKITQTIAESLSYIDISFDGGELTYEKYRKGNFKDLMEKINFVNKQYNFSSFNALHVVNSLTIQSLDDMIDVKKFFPFKSIMFSPYIETTNDGTNFVEKLNIEQILSTFASNKNFLNTQEAFILLDVYHLIGELKTDYTYSEFSDAPNMDMVKRLISKYNLDSKVKLIEKDPIHHGFVRLTYDGFMLSPYASLNPTDYRKEGVRIEEMTLAQFFDKKSHLKTQVA